MCAGRWGLLSLLLDVLCTHDVAFVMRSRRKGVELDRGMYMTALELDVLKDSSN